MRTSSSRVKLVMFAALNQLFNNGCLIDEFGIMSNYFQMNMKSVFASFTPNVHYIIVIVSADTKAMPMMLMNTSNDLLIKSFHNDVAQAYGMRILTIFSWDLLELIFEGFSSDKFTIWHNDQQLFYGNLRDNGITNGSTVLVKYASMTTLLLYSKIMVFLIL